SGLAEVSRVGGGVADAALGRAVGDPDADVAELRAQDVGPVARAVHPHVHDRFGRGVLERAPGDVLAERVAVVAGAVDAAGEVTVVEVLVVHHRLGVTPGRAVELRVVAQRAQVVKGALLVEQAERGLLGLGDRDARGPRGRGGTAGRRLRLRGARNNQ